MFLWTTTRHLTLHQHEGFTFFGIIILLCFYKTPAAVRRFGAERSETRRFGPVCICVCWYSGSETSDLEPVRRRAAPRG